MKKSLILAGMLAVGYANAQSYEERVGINTDTPSATLNVKTATDSKSPKNLELENANGTKLVTVLNTGNVGIGTDEPQHSLDVRLNNTGLSIPINVRNINTSSRNQITLNTGGITETGRNTLGIALMGKNYTDTTPSFSGNNAVIYSTTTNGLNFQVHQKDAKFKFYNGGIGEGALTMSVLPKQVLIDTDKITSASLTIGSNDISDTNQTSTGTANRLALISSSVDGENLISYYDANQDLDAQIGINTGNKNMFQVKLFDATKHFGIYEHGATRFTLNNGFARIGRQSGEIPAILTLDGYESMNEEKLGIRLQSTETTSTYATMYFNRSEEGEGGMRFKVTHNKHGYVFDTNKQKNALKIEAEGNVGIGVSNPSNKLHIIAEANPLKLEGLQEGTGSALVIDANGVVKKGGASSSTATNGTQNEKDMPCNDANRGKMNFVKDVALASGGTADAFAVCLKDSDGNHYWRYLYGAGGVHNGTDAFGTGL